MKNNGNGKIYLILTAIFTALFILALFILCEKAKGADVVETTIDMLNTGGSKQQTVQGIPREHIAPGTDSTDVFIIHSWYVSSFYDHVFKWTAVSPSGFSDSAYIDAFIGSHLHFTRRNDTAWIVCNPESADSVLVYLYDIANLAILDTSSFAPTGANYCLGAVEHYGGGSNMLMSYRDANPQDSNIYYATSSDNGLTWTGQGDIIAYNDDCRFDIDPWGDSIYALTYLRGTTKKYDYLMWNGSAWSSVADTVIAEEGSAIYERLFSTCIGLDGMHHLVWSDTAVPSHVIHAYWHPDSSDWVVGNAYTADTKIENPEAMWTALTHSEYGEITRLYYTTSTADNQYHKLYCMKWNNSNYTWGSPIQVTGDSTITNLAGCMNVPAGHKDRSYILYTCYVADGNDYINRFAVIRDSTTTEYSEGGDSVHTVSSLPHSFTQGDHSGTGYDTVKLSGDLISTGNGITFTDCHDWVVLFEGNTITFANDSTANTNYGIGFGSNDDSYNIILRGNSLRDTIYDTLIYQNDTIVDTIHRYIGGQIKQAVVQTIDTNTYVANDTTNHHNVCVAMGYNTSNITIEYIYMEVNGYSCKGISLGGGGNFLIQHCNIRSNSPFFDTRSTYQGAAIIGLKTWDSSLILDNTYDYHARCYDVKVERSPYSGIVMAQASGWHRLEVEACTLNVDAWNIRYVGGEGDELGTANCYGVHTLRQGRGFIKDCKITSGIRHKGGRGIMLERPKGVVDTLIEVSGNYCDNHEGVCVQFTAAYFPCNFKARSQPRGVWVHDNTFIFTADGSVPTDSTEQNNNAYYWSGESVTWEVNVFAAGWSPPYNVTVENNIFKARDRSNGGWLAAVIFGAWYDATSYDNTFIWRNNWVESDSIGYEIAGYDGGTNYVRVMGDTLTLVDTGSGHCAYFMGYGTHSPYDGENTIFRDMVYRYDSGGTDTGHTTLYDTNIVFPNSNTSDIMLEETIQFLVLDSSSNPVEDAIVKMINASSDSVMDTTNASGEASVIVGYWYEYRGGSGTNDSTTNPYSVDVWKALDTALDTNWTIDCNRAEIDTVMFGAAAPAPTTNSIKFDGIKLKGVTIK
jgi:hypothetical protein